MPDEETLKYGPGWSLSDFEHAETQRLLQEFLDGLREQPIHRYVVGDILRDIARKVEEREL